MWCLPPSNGVFIPACKTYFNLDQFQSQLIDFAFYGAYYLGALLLFIFGSGPIKGFAVTLSLGIVASMFTAILLTNLLTLIWYNSTKPKKIMGFNV